MIDLKPCPFCGSSDVEHVAHSFPNYRQPHLPEWEGGFVCCNGCGATIDGDTNGTCADTVKAQIFEAWNKRAGDGE